MSAADKQRKEAGDWRLGTGRSTPQASSLKPQASSDSTQHFSRWRLVLLVACFALPLLGFAVAGALWLYDRGWLGWASLAFAVGQTLAFVLFRRWMRGDRAVLPQPALQPPPEFSPREEAAWAVVQAYQEQVDKNELVLESLEQLLELGKEILGRISAFYQPEDKEPLLAVQIPLLFRAIEETARDLAMVTAQLPFSHRITISEIVRGYQFGQKMKPAYELYQLYRYLSPLINPQSGLLRLFVTDRLFDLTKETLNQWLLRWYVDRVGYHAIELYSGRLLLTQRHESVGALQPETAEILEQARAETREPLRILVLGQVKAGKSSLVNALFGEVRAATDSVPTTTQLTSYVLERSDLAGQVLLYDMGGYADPSAPKERKAQVLAEAVRADLVILVVSAANVAREPDKQLLTEVRAHFAVYPVLRPPPVIVALTHIDLLRPPLEWSPPYNVATSDSPKARSIRGALDAVATDLGLAPEYVAPVCLLPERLYNVEEVLAPLLSNLLPEAKRVLLLRNLKTARAQEQWELLWRQAWAAGRFVFAIGGGVLKKSVEKILLERRT
jgi:predicted GTPase